MVWPRDSSWLRVRFQASRTGWLNSSILYSAGTPMTLVQSVLPTIPGYWRRRWMGNLEFSTSWTDGSGVTRTVEPERSRVLAALRSLIRLLVVALMHVGSWVSALSSFPNGCQFDWW